MAWNQVTLIPAPLLKEPGISQGPHWRLDPQAAPGVGRGDGGGGHKLTVLGWGLGLPGLWSGTGLSRPDPTV